MLRIIHSVSSKHAKSYYSEGVTREGYYAEGQEMAGLWGGKAALKLGLLGRVEQRAFALLCDNLNPSTGEPLTPRNMANRRVGYDFNFNLPKSVSIVYEYTQDQHILDAFRESMRETMEELEHEAATRVRAGGRDCNRKTGNLVWAEFIHFTARPEDGTPDPHLHGHCFVFNATFDPVEKKWKAGQFGDIIQEASYYQAAFHARMARRLRELGYPIQQTGVSYEIEGITRELIKKFSRRTERIEAEAARRGIDSAAEKDKLAALTREKKVENLSKTELHALWWDRLSKEEIEALEGFKTFKKRIPVIHPIVPGREREAVAFAIEHLFERQSVVTERELLAQALEWGAGYATVQGVKEAIKEFPLIRRNRDGQELITTAEVVAEEKRVIDYCKRSKNTVPSLNPNWEIKNTRLNGQQRNAVMHVLKSRDKVTGIVGKAGTGKTTLLQELRLAIETSGLQILALAPGSDAARGTLRGDGFKEAETIEMLLHSPQLQEMAKNRVWFVDEAGMVSSRTMDKLLKLAEASNARVVLVGDTGQHHAVERGQAFDLLQRFGGMSVVSVDEIQRQKGDYKKLVEYVQAHENGKAFEILEHNGWIEELPVKEMGSALAADYVRTVAEGYTALVISPTHQEREKVTRAIRDKLKETGHLKEGVEWSVLNRLDWTDAQRRDARQYELGQVVQISGAVPGFSRGERLEVIEIKDGKVIAANQWGYKPLPLDRPRDFSVFEANKLEVCEGERIRITGNGRSLEGHRLNNGSLYTVDYIGVDERLVLDNGWRLEKDFEHIEWGYAVTSHMAQSKTVDFEFLAQSDLISSGASNANQFYVSISRGRKGVKVYTDSIDILRENVSRTADRKMATEMMSEQTKLSVVMESPVVKLKALEPRSASPKRVPEKSVVVQKKTEVPVKKREAGLEQQL